MSKETETSEQRMDQLLASGIIEAAKRTTKRFGDRKAFICGIFEETKPVSGFSWLARRLVDLNRKGLIELSRADLVGLMDSDWVARSEVSYLNATFHFVIIP